ncbi:hypothetical protein C9J03_23460 [Photobacterium gaetbulicola]|uniref:Glucosamine/galactosamine-6-phosphate isomerase domain-containing protein n=1 Tax=Photobacterium gaetbulicola Gung47 TaxID=658445 RepID=A0A0C5W4U2_9GAMM|nr:6-phosphogluconolactonase [Photobacterium gaetbulicola]AJR06491.1 hypothetical protein H744_1c1469 [Photobacterium gaetbulicola Gung47]PSU02518.1 hypothetical protein C9J03_23460 [Photobacterium gaetbulicola]
MNTTTFTRYTNCSEQGAALARYILSGVEKARANNRPYLLGCPGGRSPMAVYQAMAEQAGLENQDLSHLIIIMMDDYVLDTDQGLRQADADAHYSCRRFAEVDIRQRLNSDLESSHQIPKENVWFPDLAAPQEYDNRIKAAGGIDYFILATGGSDGHVAFNPPGTSLHDVTRVTKLADTTRTDNLGTFPDFKSLAEVPEYGLTIGPASIAALSKEAGLLIDGEHKKQAVRKIFQSDRYDESWPSTIIHECKNAKVHVVDDAIPDDVAIG